MINSHITYFKFVREGQMFAPKRKTKFLRAGSPRNVKKQVAPHVCPFHKHHRHTSGSQSPNPEHSRSPRQPVSRKVTSRRRTQQPLEPSYVYKYDAAPYVNHSIELVSHNFQGLLTNSQKTELYRQLFWDMDYSLDSDKVIRQRAFRRLNRIYQEEYDEADKIVKQSIKERIAKRKHILAKIQKEKEMLLDALSQSQEEPEQTVEYVKLPPIGKYSSQN